VKRYWKIIADNLRKAGCSRGCVSAVTSEGRIIWIVDAHRDNGKRFGARSDEKLTAFLELERVTCESLRFPNAEWFGTIRALQPFARFSLGKARNRLQGLPSNYS
jgi:hypothetical protein